MKPFLILVLAAVLTNACNNSRTGLERYELDCSVEMDLNKFMMNNRSYSIEVPSSWEIQILEPANSNEISTVIFNDTISELYDNGKFVQLKILVITNYIGKYKSLEEENKNSLKGFQDLYPNSEIIEKGSTNIFSEDAYYVEFRESTDMGNANTIMFLVKDNQKNDEYFVLNSTIYGDNISDLEVCEMLNILRTFNTTD